MPELEGLLSVSPSYVLSPTVLVLAVYFVVPGLIAMKVYDLTIPPNAATLGIP
jgi:hypothetical protein